jgi:hypothetical protein
MCVIPRRYEVKFYIELVNYVPFYKEQVSAVTYYSSPYCNEPKNHDRYEHHDVFLAFFLLGENFKMKMTATVSPQSKTGICVV